ncbi:MAG: cbb3-type cytochrome oxidase assembly protein CcoS [Sandaracinaceae bacterium]|nr:MAG: cbb3-type cytochrome oxidase assembly protein CcoS [Sandaracinaceae bacterium]HBQ17259.1 cytochrome oxidase [Myxococcales bacterium]
MEVLILTLFVSLVLAGAGALAFVWSIGRGSHEHADRLALLPLRDDPQPSDEDSASSSQPPSLPEDR